MEFESENRKLENWNAEFQFKAEENQVWYIQYNVPE
jgi:hypothetical protein